MTTWSQAADALAPGRRARARHDQRRAGDPEERVADGAAAGPDPATETSVALERALRAIGSTLQQALERAAPPVTPVHLRCLHALDRSGGATVGDVALAAGIAPSTASRTADRLVAAGLVSRSASARDRRQVSLDLTPAGRRTLAEVTGVRVAALAAAVGRMDADDRAALLRGAGAFAAAHAEVAGRPSPVAGAVTGQG